MTVHDTQEERPDENPEQSENMTDMQAEQAESSVTNLRPTVGDELRMRREEAGHTTHELAEAIRIQRRYLEALEAGRLEDLPGTVYALGFLRTYAEYYGLNGDEFVTRFKEETEGHRREQDYSLPEPIEEAKVPTAAIVILAIVLAVGAYVAWYSLRPQDTEITGALPEVPGQTATVTEEATSAPAPAMPEPQPTATAPAEPQPSPEPPAETAASPEAPAVENVEAEALPPETPPAAVAVVETPVAPAEPETPAAEAPTPTPEQVTVATPSATPEAVAPSAPAVDETPYVPQSFGTENANARIVITAADDAWIEISDPDGNRLLSRTMRAGDSYRVPDREGLVFVTGNAGGLNITVDGQPAPAIGGTGIVRKNVKLDPELLKQGRAWP